MRLLARFVFGLAAAAVAAPALALTMSPPPSPVSGSPVRFADPDAALDQSGSAIQQGFVNSALGVRGAAYSAYRDASPSFGALGPVDQVAVQAPVAFGRAAPPAPTTASPPRR